MSIFGKAEELLEKGKKSIIKRKVKSTINNKFNLDGKFDDEIDRVADRAVEKIGTDNIIKANKVLKKLKSQ